MLGAACFTRQNADVLAAYTSREKSIDDIVGPFDVMVDVKDMLALCASFRCDGLAAGYLRLRAANTWGGTSRVR